MDFHWRRVLLYAELEYQADLYAHGNCRYFVKGTATHLR